MFREKDNLPDVSRIMQELAVDGLHDGVGLAPDGDSSCEIGGGERFDGGEDGTPAGFPDLDQLPAGLRRCLELAIAVAVRLLTVRGEEVCPTRLHVAGHVLHEGGDGVGFRVEDTQQVGIGNLFHRSLGLLLVLAEQSQDILQIGSLEFHGYRIDETAVTAKVPPVYIKQDVTKAPQAGLDELVAELAVSAVGIQRMLDAQRAETLRHFTEQDIECLETFGLASLLAPAQQVSEFRVATDLSVSVSKERELRISVRPVNLAYRLKRGTRQVAESRIEICVNRVPLPEGARPKTTAAGAAVSMSKEGSLK